MRFPRLYRALIGAMPLKPRPFTALKQRVPDSKLREMNGILHRHRALGGALALFDMGGITDHFVYGNARKGMPVDASTAFRLASVSKLVTACGVLKMTERGLVDLDADAGRNLPYSLRHPAAPNTPLTLRMLLTHTAGIRDSAAYLNSIIHGKTAEGILQAGSFTPHLPGRGCEYSNFGAGLSGCVVEAETGLSFEAAMQEYLFRPLGMRASFYPQRVGGPLADARRILPPRLKPNFNAIKRQAQKTSGWDLQDVQRHYALAHGNCCMDAESAAKLGTALMQPGFFKEETLHTMRHPQAVLGERDPSLALGIGLFILNDQLISPHPLYGHQGMAYGAVQMLFWDLKLQRGIISLTTGVSEARQHILADVNKALLKSWQEH